MNNEIIPYLDMCQREATSLQQGMNFRLSSDHSVILMSVRSNAPYRDRTEEDGTILIYEGHDEPHRKTGPDSKTIDQPERTFRGSLTQNGKFHKAAQDHKRQGVLPERVRVYEKIIPGIWSHNGLFLLVDSWTEYDGKRNVFKFKLIAVEDDSDVGSAFVDNEPSRVIPSAVKLKVWKRDKGQCRICGAKTQLHFDHIIPYSKGGTSLDAENIQLLCLRHNLAKSDRIE